MSEQPTTPVALSGTLWPFRYDGLPLVGGLVRLGPEWAELVSERGYSECSAQLLGEALCTVALLAGSAKTPPRLTLQLSGAADVQLLVAQSLRPGQLRGMVKPAGLESLPFGKGGRLVMTLESDRQQQAAQSIVPLDGDSLAQAMQQYFDQSEQLPSRFYLKADQTQAFGLLVQRVAGDDADVSAALQVVENWALPELPPEPERFLGALLDHDIALIEPVQPWKVECHCDAGSVSRMLLGLGIDEARELAEKQGSIQIECGYCGAQYAYDRTQVEQLFAADAAEPPAAPRN